MATYDDFELEAAFQNVRHGRADVAARAQAKIVADRAEWRRLLVEEQHARQEADQKHVAFQAEVNSRMDKAERRISEAEQTGAIHRLLFDDAHAELDKLKVPRHDAGAEYTLAGRVRELGKRQAEADALLSKYADWHKQSHEALDGVGVARMTDGRAPRTLHARVQDACARLAEAEACLDNASKHHTARALGLQAREHGEVREAVPYPEHTTEWRGWLIGWVQADQDAQLAESEAGKAVLRQALEEAREAIYMSKRADPARDHMMNAALATDAGRAHLEADAKREALGRRLSERLEHLPTCDDWIGRLCDCDLEAIKNEAIAAGWLQEEDKR